MDLLKKESNVKKIKKNKHLNDGEKILSNTTKKNIEKSYNIESVNNTEAYYSNRYGWTLRKALD